MVTNLKISNFKCFQSISIPINRLTVLAGANGNGKSTTIQALLLLRKTLDNLLDISEGKKITTDALLKSENLPIELNGPYNLSLGNSDIIIPVNSQKDIDIIEIGIENSTPSKFNVEYLTNSINKLAISPSSFEILEPFDNGLFLKEFYYLNAERLGPRVTQKVKYLNFPNTGFQGEFVAQLIGDTDFNYTFKVDKTRCFDETKNLRLEQQLNAWMNFIMPGVAVNAVFNSETLNAQVTIENNYNKGNPTISTNIGFGISYVLPILVTGLIANNNSFFIVENPEAHLHPTAQSRIGQFLAIIAESGVNIIVETHSDHVLNGIQIATASKRINPDSITINYFDKEKELTQPKIDTLSINSLGELSKWPEGFFDQSQQDFKHLFKIRKNG